MYVPLYGQLECSHPEKEKLGTHDWADEIILEQLWEKFQWKYVAVHTGLAWMPTGRSSPRMYILWCQFPVLVLQTSTLDGRDVPIHYWRPIVYVVLQLEIVKDSIMRSTT
jgi:hypothetical protein